MIYVLRSPQELINHLVETSETRANGSSQDDAVTFVVIGVK